MNYILKNKKGIFFTTIVIAVLFLFLASYSFYSLVKERKVAEKRIQTLNDFVFSVEKDLPRQLYASGFRVLFLFEKRIISNGTYITDFDGTFREAFFNGTIYSIPEDLMIDADFTSIKNSLEDKGNKINAFTSLSNPYLEVSQDDPWNVKLTLTVELAIADKGELASWNKTSVVVSYIPVTNFEDPLYAIGTNSLVTRKINATVYDFPEDNIINLSLQLENYYYIASPMAPSFLDRLQGITEGNPNGIESLVYLPELSAQGIQGKDKSCVDYIYFSANDTASFKIQGMPDWFKLDEPHLAFYNVEGLKIV